MKKEEAIKAVLSQRYCILKEKVIPRRSGEDRAYYQGKADGYAQAIDLLNTTLEGIQIEIK